MILYSDTLDMSDLEAIASHVGIELYNAEPFHGARRRRATFVLRPMSGSDTFRAISHTGRRKWAVSWAGHYAFLEAVFNADPDAELRSSTARYNGREEFLVIAPLTGGRNVGSQVEPLRHRDDDIAGAGESVIA